MKYRLLVVALTFALFSCKPSDNTSTNNSQNEPQNTTPAALSLIQDSTEVGFTAYKTSEKKPVHGIFQSFTISNLQTGSSPKDILNGASISIKTGSVFSKDSTRDGKLRAFFFEKLAPEVHAILLFEGEKAFLTLNFNGVEQKLPIEYSLSGNVFTMAASIQLADFKALDALKLLHEACQKLHTGSDGVSKTWEEVTISGKVVFR